MSSPPAADSWQPGTIVAGRYRIVDLLGEGGMGRVYRAEDLVLNQTVSLKFLNPAMASDREWLDRFRKEVRMARTITHSNVCRVYDISEADGVASNSTVNDPVCAENAKFCHPPPEVAVAHPTCGASEAAAVTPLTPLTHTPPPAIVIPTNRKPINEKFFLDDFFIMDLLVSYPFCVIASFVDKHGQEEMTGWDSHVHFWVRHASGRRPIRR